MANINFDQGMLSRCVLNVMEEWNHWYQNKLFILHFIYPSLQIHSKSHWALSDNIASILSLNIWHNLNQINVQSHLFLHGCILWELRIENKKKFLTLLLLPVIIDFVVLNFENTFPALGRCFPTYNSGQSPWWQDPPSNASQVSSILMICIMLFPGIIHLLYLFLFQNPAPPNHAPNCCDQPLTCIWPILLQDVNQYLRI